MQSLVTWFEVEQNRQKVYLFFAAIGTALVSIGVATEAVIGTSLELVGWLLSAFSGILMLSRLNWDQRIAWFGTGGRAAVYAGGVAFLGFGLAFGWWGDGDVALWTVYLGQGLNVLSAGLAMLAIQDDVVATLDMERETDVANAMQGTLFTEE